MTDPRFTRLRTDPRFRRPAKRQSKVVVDERFKNIFEGDEKGKRKARAGRVDKFGRKLPDTQVKDDLGRFYHLEEKKPEDDPPTAPDYARGDVLLESSSEEESDEPIDHADSDTDDGREVVLGSQASKPIHIPADGQLEIDLNEDVNAFQDLDAQAAAYSAKNQAEATYAIEGIKTNRLAVVNLDWDHVRASHLYKIFSSLVSPTARVHSEHTVIHKNGKSSDGQVNLARGKVLNVRVYPSEFGKGRLRREETEGPPKEIFKKSRRGDVEQDEDVNDIHIHDEDEGDEYDEDALRQYQLERLRYYYAIVTCDTVGAAVHIYTELDGTELERSANVFDLSFVPDDMEFEGETRDEATPVTETTAAPFKGLNFATDALRHSKVKMTWDEDDPERNKVTRRHLSQKDIEEGNFKTYLASSSESSGDEHQPAQLKSRLKSAESQRDKLRALLLGGHDDNVPEGWGGREFEKEDGSDMEITFMPGLSEAKKDEEKGEETTLEKYKRKQKERRLRQKKERKDQSTVGKDDGVDRKVVGDDFFGEDDDSGDEDKRNPTRKEANRKQMTGKGPKSRPASTDAELALLVTSDNPAVEPNHFDLKAVLKAEKSKGWKVKRSKRKHGDEGDGEVQEDFKIDVRDERFQALHDDHIFAIDPSNPQFKKTKSMAALLEERAKRQKVGLPDYESKITQNDAGRGGKSLQSLVERVKRKSAVAMDERGFGKRQKS